MASEETVYCLCRQPYDETRFMIECNVCKDWFHGTYVSLCIYGVHIVTANGRLAVNLVSHVAHCLQIYAQASAQESGPESGSACAVMIMMMDGC